MAIPIILGAAVLAAGAFGVKKGLDAKRDFNEADKTNEDGKDIVYKADHALSYSHDKANDALESLGRIKFEIYKFKIIPFVDSFNKIKHINFQGDRINRDLNNPMDQKEFKSIEELALRMKDIAVGGIASLGAGGLTGLAAYGSVGLLASTAGGTAIGTLSGVAATNATLAWLGGGSLAAGGFGMAGGALVLGGLVAGPALAVGGMMLASKAEAAKEDALSNLMEAKVYAEKIALAKSATDAMRAHILELTNTLVALDKIFSPLLEGLQSLIEHSRKDFSGMVDYETFSEEDQKGVMMSFAAAKTIKNVLEVQIFDERGIITEASKAIIANTTLEIDR